MVETQMVHTYRGYTLNITARGVDVIEPKGNFYVMQKVSLEAAIFGINNLWAMRQQGYEHRNGHFRLPPIDGEARSR